MVAAARLNPAPACSSRTNEISHRHALHRVSLNIVQSALNPISQFVQTARIHGNARFLDSLQGSVATRRMVVAWRGAHREGRFGYGRYRLGADVNGAGDADDAGPGLLLRRAGAAQECALHHHAQLLHPGADQRAVGALGILAGLCPGREPHRRARLARLCGESGRSRTPTTRRRSRRSRSWRSR